MILLQKLGLPAQLIDRLLGTAGRQRLSILIYHRVLECEDYMRPGDPTKENFDWQMALIARYFNPLSLADALRLVDAGELPDRAVCVTFDDGYADNAEVALPILKKWNIPATVFVSTSFLNGGRMWNDTVIEAVRASTLETLDLSSLNIGIFPLGMESTRVETAHSILRRIKHLSPTERQLAVDFIAEQSGELPNDLMLTSKQLSYLHDSGVEIGAHTQTHPILTTLSPDEVRQEIAGSKQHLEKAIGAPIRFFAYPNGQPGNDYHETHKDIVRNMGFDAALSTQWGVSDRNTDRWQLPRFTPWDKTSARFLVRLLKNQQNLIV